jgi:hypothetical protein
MGTQIQILEYKMEEVTQPKTTEKIFKYYGNKLSVIGIHDVKVYSDNTAEEIVCTEEVSSISVTPEQVEYLKGYLAFINTIAKTKKNRALPPTKNEALGKNASFCSSDMNYRKSVDSLSKKGIMKEVSWRIKSKTNETGSIMTFIVLTPIGRKFIDEKILGPQQQPTNPSTGDISQDGESVDCHPQSPV